LLQALAQVKLLQKDWLGTETVIDSLRVDNKDSALTFYLSGRVSQGQSLFEDAIAAYKLALAEQPDMSRALQGLSSSYVQLNQKQALIDYLSEFITKNPMQLAGYGVLSNVYMQDKKWGNAIATLEKGLSQEPKWQAGYGALASVYLAQDNAEKAMASYQRGLDANPDSIFITLQMASAYESRAKYDKAKSLYESVLAKDPSIEPAINNLASLLTEQFRSEENLNKAMVLVEVFKSSAEPYYLDSYAWTHVLLGNYAKAQKVLERVVSLSPNTAVFNYHIGALHLKQANTLEAENYLNKAKALAKQQGDSLTAKNVAELLATL